MFNEKIRDYLNSTKKLGKPKDKGEKSLRSLRIKKFLIECIKIGFFVYE